MTRDEMVAEIQVYLGFRTDQATVIAAQIQAQQRALETTVKWVKRPWFLQSDRSSTVVTATVDGFDERILLPDDWMADIEEDGLWITDSEGKEHLLIKNEENVLRSTFINDNPTLPSHYCRSGDYYRLFPTPDAAYTIKMRYYQKDAVLSTNTSENRWSRYAPNILIGRAGMFLAGTANNARQEMLSAMYREAKEAIESQAVYDDADNRQYAMGENQ